MVNAMSKLIDIIIINKCDDNLCTSELQFSFRPEHSKLLCISAIMTIASKFVENGCGLQSMLYI